MRGGVLNEDTGKFREFTSVTKVKNLNALVEELEALKAEDPEAFELARQWDLADKFGTKEYSELPEELTVWRGHDVDEGIGKTMNVTNQLKVAEKFGTVGVVTEYKVKKDDIVFSLSNSVFGEGELLVHGKSLKQTGQTISDAASKRIEFGKWSSTLAKGDKIKTLDGDIGEFISVGVHGTLIVQYPFGINYGVHYSEVVR
jgi:hypothetical protein